MASLLDLFVKITADNSNYKAALKESREQTEMFAKLAESAGVRIATSLSMLGIAAAAIEVAEKFEKAGFSIRRTTGLAGEQLESLEESFKNLYQQSARGADEIADVLSQLHIRTGATGEALESLASATMKFAAVTNSDLQTSVKENERLFAQWSIATEDQSDALDALYVTSTRTGIGASGLTSALLALGPTLRSFGFSFRESVAIVGSFERAGLDATAMVRGMNTAFAKFAAEGKDPRQALMDLVAEMERAATAADAVNMAIEAGFAKRTAVAMADAARKGALGIEELNGYLGKSKGAVADAARETETLSTKWTKTLHVMQTELAGPGKLILDFIGTLVEGVGALVRALSAVGNALLHWKLPEPKPARSLEEFRKQAALLGMDPAIAEKVGADLSAQHPEWRRISTVTAPPPGAGGGEGASGKPDKFAALLRTSDDLAVLIEREKLAQSAHAATISEIAKSGLTVEQYWTKKWTDAVEGMDEFYGLMEKGLPRFEDLSQKVKEGGQLMQNLGANLEETSRRALEASPWGQLADSAEYFGIVTEHAAQQAADAAVAKYEQMEKTGIATERELAVAALKTAQAEIDADLAAGRISHERWEQERQDLQDNLNQWEGNSTRIRQNRFDLSRELEQMSHRMFDALERDLAKDLVEWDNFADSVRNIGKGLAEDFLSIMLKGLFKPLEDKFATLAGNIGGWLATGKWGTAAGSGGGGVTSVAGAGSGGMAAAAGGLAGTITAGASVASAISGFIGNFQMKGMNKSLDLLENYMRYIKIWTGEQSDSILETLHIIRNSLTDFLSGGVGFATLVDLTRQMTDAIVWGGGMKGGRGGITFNNCTFTGSPDAIANSIFNQAALAGAL